MEKKRIDILDPEITDAEIQEFYNQCWEDAKPTREKYFEELRKINVNSIRKPEVGQVDTIPNGETRVKDLTDVFRYREEDSFDMM